MFKQLKQSLSVWLIKKIQKHGPRKVIVHGRTYEISEKVFNPKYYYTSEFMARHISAMPEDIVLDIGTGSGIQAITAARNASRVVAIDINPEAVRFAEINVTNNGMKEKVSVIEGDLFSPLNPRKEFSIILFTPPYLEGRPETHFDHALYDPDKSLLKRFFRDANGHLKQGGYIQMIYSSIAEPEKALNIAEGLGWTHRLIAREKTFTEEFLIYRLTLRQDHAAQHLFISR